MGTVTNGLAKIEIGDPGAGGTMGTALEQLGYTNIDSANFTEEEGTTNDFNVEEMDDPIFSRTVPGKKTLTFQIADPDLDTFVAVFGGAVTGTAPDEVWEAPAKKQEKEVSIKITPETGNIIQIPRAKMRGLFNMALSKNALQMIDITADVLTPVGETADPPIIVGPLVA